MGYREVGMVQVREIVRRWLPARFARPPESFTHPHPHEEDKDGDHA